MNVIFLDIDGVLVTAHKSSNKDIEEKVKILSQITNKFNCNVILSSSMKDGVDFNPLEIYNNFLKYLFELFDKYNIKCIGKTNTIPKHISKNIYLSIWKEYEILDYLNNHNIDHFCIIDDDDLKYFNKDSDLELFRDYLVTPLYMDNDYEKEGLLPSHIDEVGKILKKENRFKR